MLAIACAPGVRAESSAERAAALAHRAEAPPERTDGSAARSDATPAPAHAAAIRELIAVTGAVDREIARVDESVAALRTTAPDLPDAVWENYSARLRDREALVALYVPAYARHLDAADTHAWLAFLRSPHGARTLAAQDPIREASRAAAQRFATAVFAELEDEAPASGAADDTGSGRHAGSDRDAAGEAGGGGAGAAADAPPVAASHAAAIRELIDAIGALGTTRATMHRLLESVRASPLARSIPPEFWSRAAERLTEPATLYALWVPAYAAHMTEQDVRALVAFHRTPAGARIAAAQPAIQAEIVEAAQRYGATAARRAVREVLGPLPQWRPPPTPGGSPPRPADPPAKPADAR